MGGLTPNSPALLNLLYCKLSSLQLDDTSAVQLARDKFQSDLIIQSLASSNFTQALNNLNFIIDAQLIEDSQGKIKAAAIKYQPKIETSNPNPNPNPTSNSTEIASSLERKGFQALLSRNLEQSQKLFESAYNAYPTYHNVDEINKLLKSKKEISDWGQQIYCPIVKQYSWKMPADVKQQMISQGNCK